ncbi:MAG: aldehyde dehydrogenase family protein [Armatimonadota bacterium]|nr:aldehyde dehydrogenase family protein [Armatimonadota bacterium]
MSSQVREALETLAYGPAPEDPKPVLRWLDARGRRFRLFIGNQWVEPTSREWFETRNPATGELLAHVPQAGPEDVERAVRAAREALPGWSRTADHVRARYLYAVARQVQKHARLLAVLETLDNGKPIRESRDVDVPLVARHFYHHAGWAQLRSREFPGHEPVGVVGQIIPWNFPLLMVAWKLAPALAAGSTVVLKPAEHTPLTALALCEILLEVGLPPGVVNVVTGDGRTGELIVQHPEVDKIAFTGSTEVGRRIRQLTAGTGKRLSLELGGKSPFVVFEDADLDAAVEGVVDSIWFNQGQVCCAGSRLLLQESIADRFLAKLRSRMEKLRVGDPLDKAVDMGAIVAPVQLERIRHLCEVGLREGARMWQPSWAVPQDGLFFPPTLFTDVSPASTLAQVEIFGPVLVSMTFRSPAEAVALANNTRYGLAASVWTENLNLALDVARRLQAGTVWVNSTNLFDAASGFGGYRESGFGREGGREGMWEYLQPAEPPRVFVWPGAGWATPEAAGGPSGHPAAPAAIDRTPKLYVGGRQVRPDAPYVRYVFGPDGRLVGEVGEGDRKDVRNAVEAARTALAAWSAASAHARAQVLYYVAENLHARAEEFARRIAAMTGEPELAEREVQAGVERLFTYAAWADKFDGAVHATADARLLAFAVHEPVGVVGVACPDEFPLLGFVSLVAPAVALGNTVVAIPSPRHPLAATDFYQVLDTSDVPGGVINIVTGDREALAAVLAQHDDVDAVWYFGTPEGAAAVERESAGNLKRTWTCTGPRDWLDPRWAEGHPFLRQATQVKNIWVPHGE